MMSMTRQSKQDKASANRHTSEGTVVGLYQCRGHHGRMTPGELDSSSGDVSSARSCLPHTKLICRQCMLQHTVVCLELLASASAVTVE